MECKFFLSCKYKPQMKFCVLFMDPIIRNLHTMSDCQYIKYMYLNNIGQKLWTFKLDSHKDLVVRKNIIEKQKKLSFVTRKLSFFLIKVSSCYFISDSVLVWYSWTIILTCGILLTYTNNNLQQCINKKFIIFSRIHHTDSTWWRNFCINQ